MAHILVIGSGMAGLIAALRAARRHDVTIVTKDVLTAGSTAWAQGGIAAALFADDSAALHARDTIAAGAGLCDPAAVAVLCQEGPARVHDLVRLGVAFDPVPGKVGRPDDASTWARGLEAAHSVARIVHAGGDATGHAIEAALVAAVREGRIRALEFARATQLIVRDGAVCGAVVASPAGFATIAADAVVLATGGSGRLYRHTTNPPVSTGDGVVLAYAAGAAIADLEFVQFHPTVLAGGGLVSEAVRGEGAVLRDAEGRRFMCDGDARGELAPRDVVARAIARTMRAQGGEPVVLDARMLGAEVLRRRFPTIDAFVRTLGFDWAVTPVPVTPAAHYAMGGVLADMNGRTTVAGLFAVGETAATGAHGANRLASNSLLEAVVAGWRAGDTVGPAGSVPPLPLPRISTIQESPHSAELQAPVPVVTTSAADALVDGPTPWSADRVRDRAWEALGLERNGPEMADFVEELADAQPADDEARTLLPLARLTAAAALARTESRGAHWRADCANPDPGQRLRRVIVRSSIRTPELWSSAGRGAERAREGVDV